MAYKHFVFCAGIMPCNEKAIEDAKSVMESLDEQWRVEEDCVLQAYHSEFTRIESAGNVEICLSNRDEHQLISDCMEFAVAMYRKKLNN